MAMRLAAALGTFVVLVSWLTLTGAPVAGQARPTPPPLVITAFGGAPTTYTAPRTPWGDPDLQGVWSSDDMENVPMAAFQGRGAAPPVPAQTPPLYLDGAALAARKTQVDNAATQRQVAIRSGSPPGDLLMNKLVHALAKLSPDKAPLSP